MQTFVTIIHVTTCVLLVLVVLIQSGKGAEISTTLGGSSQTVFGSSGGANFFTRFTSAAAAVFMVTSLTLTLMGGQTRKSLFETATGTAATVPAVPATGTTGGTGGGAPGADAQKPAAEGDKAEQKK